MKNANVEEFSSSMCPRGGAATPKRAIKRGDGERTEQQIGEYEECKSKESQKTKQRIEVPDIRVQLST